MKWHVSVSKEVVLGCRFQCGNSPQDLQFRKMPHTYPRDDPGSLPEGRSCDITILSIRTERSLLVIPEDQFISYCGRKQLP